MTFASMTGFAESAGSHDGAALALEAKSVNSRSWTCAAHAARL